MRFFFPFEPFLAEKSQLREVGLNQNNFYKILQEYIIKPKENDRKNIY